MPAAEKASVLLVDGDDGVLEQIGNILGSRGLHVVQASNGREALSRISERCFPVLLTAWRMPVMDGIELAREVRSRGMDETCIVMHLPRHGVFDYERGYRAGIDDYLTNSPSDAGWLARIHAAFKTAALRTSLRAARASLAAAHGPLADVSAASRTSNDDVETTALLPALVSMPAPKVLLVDDDHILLERLTLGVHAMGYEVFTAADGATALALLGRHPMSIVILDRNMPALDGLELCRTIRRGIWPCYVYVILLTAHDDEEDVLLGLEAGADDYLSKRISDAHFRARLSTATRILALEHSLKSALDQRERMAMTDALTGAHNRRYFMRYLRGELKRARRFGTALSLLAIDIDCFKLVNDLYGHQAGDVVLKKLVKRIERFLPHEYDWCARLGGEEFAVVLPQTDLAGAAVLAEKLRRSVAELSIRLGGEARAITVSIGVSGLSAMPLRETTTAEMLLAHADRFLYESKESGRNRVTSAAVTSAGVR